MRPSSSVRPPPGAGRRCKTVRDNNTRAAREPDSRGTFRWDRCARAPDRSPRRARALRRRDDVRTELERGERQQEKRAEPDARDLHRNVGLAEEPRSRRKPESERQRKKSQGGERGQRRCGPQEPIEMRTLANDGAERRRDERQQEEQHQPWRGDQRGLPFRDVADAPTRHPRIAGPESGTGRRYQRRERAQREHDRSDESPTPRVRSGRDCEDEKPEKETGMHVGPEQEAAAAPSEGAAKSTTPA